MRFDLIFTAEAETDLNEAYSWYESRRVGLGEEFFSSVEACLEGIRRMPAMYAIVHEEFRRALIRRFPYAIFYEYVDALITVYAVLHTSRDPDKLRSRLLSR